jgi:hypothetical protein
MHRPRRTHGLVIGLGVIVPLLAGLSTDATAQATGRDGSAKPKAKASGGAPASEKGYPFGVPRGPGAAGAVTPILFIQHKAIKDELGLTDDQLQRIQRANSAFDQKRLDLARAFTKPGGGVDQTELMGTITRLRGENEAALNKVLTPKQRTRLAQIVLQLKGPLAVADTAVAPRLNLSPEQVELIQSILVDYQRARDRVYDDGRARIDAASAPPIAGAAGPAKAGTKTKADAQTKDGGPKNVGTKAKADAQPEGGAPAKAGAKTKADAQPNDGTARDERVRAEIKAMEGESERLHQEAVRQVGRVLTRGQKDVFNKMLAAPFDLSLLDPRKPPLSRAASPADPSPELEPIPAASKPRPKGAP